MSRRNGHPRHGHDHPHPALRVDPSVGARRSVHRLGRRGFLTELGRRGFAVAILGGAVAACSESDDAADGVTTSTGTNRSDTTGSGTSTVPAGTSAPDSEVRVTSTAPDAQAQETSTPRDPGTTSDSGRSSDDAQPGPLGWSQVSFGFVSAYVLTRGNAAVVVDTGTAGNADQIGETLAMLGLTYGDVEHVVLTHHHPDHIGSLPEVIQRADGAIAHAGELDIPNIAGADVSAVGDGDDVFGLRVIETPGHTPGSISLFDPGIGLLIAGDALNGNDDGTAVLGPNE